jgi:hypothetical protein
MARKIGASDRRKVQLAFRSEIANEKIVWQSDEFTKNSPPMGVHLSAIESFEIRENKEIFKIGRVSAH